MKNKKQQLGRFLSSPTTHRARGPLTQRARAVRLAAQRGWSGRRQLAGRRRGFGDSLHAERKRGKGGRTALGEGWGGVLVQGRGGIKDGHTGGRAWSAGKESRSGGVIELYSNARGGAITALEVVTSRSGVDLAWPRCGRWMELDGDGLARLDSARR
jgi:hypothetical protein